MRSVAGLIVPARPAGAFLDQCRRYWAAARARLEPRTVAAARRRLRSGRVRGVRVGDAGPGAGRGLFAVRAFRPGQIIGEYAGRLSQDWKPLSEGGTFNPYLLRYPFSAAYAIDAREAGNQLRFVNHSARRANARRLHVLWKGVVRVLFSAKKAIPAGAQILIDYGPEYWRDRSLVELIP